MCPIANHYLIDLRIHVELSDAVAKHCTNYRIINLIILNALTQRVNCRNHHDSEYQGPVFGCKLFQKIN